MEMPPAPTPRHWRDRDLRRGRLRGRRAAATGRGRAGRWRSGCCRTRRPGSGSRRTRLACRGCNEPVKFKVPESSATLFEMNEQELRTYALRGLTARLTELDEERARILVLLGQWEETAKPAASRKARRAPRQSETAHSVEPPIPPARDCGVVSPAADIEVARVLPRRNGAVARPAPTEAAPPLPPMPRLVKARPSEQPALPA